MTYCIEMIRLIHLLEFVLFKIFVEAVSKEDQRVFTTASIGEQSGRIGYGSVEKSRQRRSRPFAVLTFRTYAPRVKLAAALMDGLFEPTRSL